MKNKKNIIFIIILILSSFLISILFDILVVNKEVLGKKSDFNPEIIELGSIEKKGNNYVTTSKNSYIVLKIKDNYINKLKFNYKYNKNFSWKVKLNEETFKFDSTKMLKKAIKKIDRNADIITIEFNNKNIKLSNFEIANHIYMNFDRIIFMSIAIIILGLFLKFKNYFIENIDKAFILIALSFGISLMFVSPKLTYNSYDDQIHFKNMLNILLKSDQKVSYAEQILIEGINLRDANYYENKEEEQELYKYLNKVHKASKQRTMNTTNGTNYYKKLIYLLFTIGYKLSDMVGIPFILCIIISKIFNLLLYILLFTLAIRYAKYGKKVIFLLGIFPTNLFLASQFSYDPTIIAGIILGTTLFINLLTEEKLNKKYLIMFVLVIIWASLPKAIYCPLLLLLLLIKNDKFDNKKQAYIFKSLIIFITILLMITFVLPTASGTFQADTRGGNTSVSGQLNLIIHNPIFYILVLSKFTIFNIFNLFFGSGNFINFVYLVNNDIFIPFYVVYLLLFTYEIITSQKPNINIKNKLFLILGIIIIYLFICTALYLSYTPVGSYSIGGVQPRYFLPLLLLLSYILMFRKEKEKNIKLFEILIPIVLLIIVIGILSLNVI